MVLRKKTPILDQFEAQNILPDLCQIHFKSSQPISSEFMFCLPAHFSSSQNQSPSTFSVCSLLPGCIIQHLLPGCEGWLGHSHSSTLSLAFAVMANADLLSNGSLLLWLPLIAACPRDHQLLLSVPAFTPRQDFWGLSWDFLVSMVLHLT